MRRNLRAVRTRQDARDLREELATLAFGTGGWVNLHARVANAPRPKRLATHEDLDRLLPDRPGTPDGGF